MHNTIQPYSNAVIQCGSNHVWVLFVLVFHPNIQVHIIRVMITVFAMMHHHSKEIEVELSGIVRLPNRCSWQSHVLHHVEANGDSCRLNYMYMYAELVVENSSSSAMQDEHSCLGLFFFFGQTRCLHGKPVFSAGGTCISGWMSKPKIELFCKHRVVQRIAYLVVVLFFEEFMHASHRHIWRKVLSPRGTPTSVVTRTTSKTLYVCHYVVSFPLHFLDIAQTSTVFGSWLRIEVVLGNTGWSILANTFKDTSNSKIILI